MKKDKVILVNPGLIYRKPINHGTYPNTAVMVLSTILVNSGFRVKIIDGNYHSIDDSVRSILSEVDDSLIFVGFSVMTIQLPWAYYVSMAVKSRKPSVPIVWGGAHPTLFPEETVDDPAIDIVVKDDAAGTIALLAGSLAEGADPAAVPGIYYKDNKRITHTPPNLDKDDFNKIPFIDFSVINHELYSRKNSVAMEECYGNEYNNRRVYPEITAIGCPYKCTFCINVILNKRYRFREAGDIVERVKYLNREYGANFIQPLDENFFSSRKRTFEFLDLLEKEKMDIKWRPQVRADYFDKDYINIDTAKRLDRSGMVIAAMGVESASQWVLDKLHKNMKVESIMRALEILSKTNIVPKMNFMVGIPGETAQDIEKTYRFAVDIRKKFKRSYVLITPFRPYPGSELYEEIISKYGYKPPSSLAEWARLSEREFAEGYGYESFESYKWIEGPGRLKAMQYVYDQAAWSRAKLHGKIRSWISMTRFRFGFFHFTMLERRFFEAVSRLGRLVGGLRLRAIKKPKGL